MGFFSQTRSTWIRSLCCAGLFCACSTARASSTSKHPVTLTPWAQAEKAREEFEAQSEGTHTKASYLKILDGYRSIYHDDPADPHAADAVHAVAELLAEQGRELHDPASLRNSIGQYEFLRSQYPASALRNAALLAEGRIEEKDLAEPAVARAKYSELVKEAPRSTPAGEARLALAEMKPGVNRESSTKTATKIEPAPRGLALTEENARVVEKRPEPASVVAAAPRRGRSEEKPELVPETAPAPAEIQRTPVPASTHTGRLAQVTGIRHWSTATYTRVAIDLGDEVTFQAARVPNPDRIYFDLHGARLGSELVGKSFAVTDDGFLKRIRAAQANSDVTRVVLDVNDVTEYSAFLLPNPYRLIIDIHGAKRLPIGATQPAEAAPQLPVAPSDTLRATAAANSSGLPATAPTDGGEVTRALPPNSATNQNGRTIVALPRVAEARHPAPIEVAPPARPVPNTVAVKAPATTTEVAAVSDAPGRVDATNRPTSKPIAATVPVNLGTGRRRRNKTAEAAIVRDPAAPAKAADKTADGETSMIRALGLKIGRIVIDAGHGGHDSGTLGVDGIEEKDVVLDVALRLGKLLHDRLGAEIIYTRSDDTFIPLETRTAIANKAQADLFLSIHANSSQDSTARGVETYYLNFTSDETALDVAARENAVSGQSIHQLSDLVKKITLKDKIAESREFASDVEGSLFAGLTSGNDGLKNRGVKKAPFVVLIGANMPSILAEISFVTNPRDASQLREPDYRERVAESLYAGVAKYEAGLAGTQPASIVRASRGQ